jgi:NACalpha-BTF3-like transcription factor
MEFRRVLESASTLLPASPLLELVTEATEADEDEEESEEDEEEVPEDELELVL